MSTNFRTFTFDKPGPLFSDSTDTKFNWRLHYVLSAALADYPLDHEAMGLESWIKDKMPEGHNVRVKHKFYNKDTNKLLFSDEFAVPQPSASGYEWWNSYIVRTWIGHSAAEISGPMTIRCEFRVWGSPISAQEWTTEFAITGTGPAPTFHGDIISPTSGAKITQNTKVRLIAELYDGVPPYTGLSWSLDGVVIGTGSLIKDYLFKDAGEHLLLFHAEDSGTSKLNMYRPIIVTGIVPPPPTDWWVTLQNWAKIALNWLGNIELSIVNKVRSLLGMAELKPNDEVVQADWVKWIPLANSLSVCVYGVNLDGSPKETPSTAELVDFALVMVPLPIGRISAIGKETIIAKGTTKYLTGLEELSLKQEALLAKGVSKPSFWRTIFANVSGAFKYLFTSGVNRKVPGVFTITEIPQIIVMTGFLTLALLAIFGKDPRDVGYKLTNPKDVFEGHYFQYRDAKDANDVFAMRTSLNGMIEAQSTFEKTMRENQQDLERQELYDGTSLYNDYMVQVIADYEAELAGSLPPGQDEPWKGKGIVYVTSDPSEANVFVDGVDSTQKTATQLFLLPGSHTIKLVKAGYKDVTISVSILEGQYIDRYVKLEVGEGEEPPEPPVVPEPPADVIILPMEPSLVIYNAWKVTIKAYDKYTAEEVYAAILINDVYMNRYTPSYFYFAPNAFYKITLKKKGYKQVEIDYTTPALPEA